MPTERRIVGLPAECGGCWLCVWSWAGAVGGRRCGLGFTARTLKRVCPPIFIARRHLHLPALLPLTSPVRGGGSGGLATFAREDALCRMQVLAARNRPAVQAWHTRRSNSASIRLPETASNFALRGGQAFSATSLVPAENRF